MEAKVHSLRVRACELRRPACFQCQKDWKYFALIVCSIRDSKLRTGVLKLTGPTQRIGPFRPEPVLSVLRTDPFHLQTGRSDWPVLTNASFGLLRLKNIYMLFAGWEVRIVKNCDRGLENAARGHRPRAAFSRPRSQFFTIRTDPKPVNNLFIYFFALPWPVGRYRRILPALTTNQNAGFVTVPSEKKINIYRKDPVN